MVPSDEVAQSRSSPASSGFVLSGVAPIALQQMCWVCSSSAVAVRKKSFPFPCCFHARCSRWPWAAFLWSCEISLTASQEDGWGWKRPVWKEFWRSSGPAVLLKQGHPEPAAQEHQCVQIALEYLQGQGLPSLTGQSLQITAVPSHPYSKNVLPDVQREPLRFQFLLDV